VSEKSEANVERVLIVDYVLERNIPSYVFTGTFDDELRDRMMTEHIEEIND